MSCSDEPCIFGNITRELYDLFYQYAGNTQVLTVNKIRPALNAIGIYPTRSQIYELVHCACEGSGRTPVDHITFGEFCVLVTELQDYYRRCPRLLPPRSQLKNRAALEERRRRRRLSVFGFLLLLGKDSQFSVFLGGSCNPTTWRHDIAIPFLKENQITFFNPQVTNWKPELMELEDQAKQTAELLFFVIDNQTRSTASMVEAAYLAGCGRQLVLVIKDFLGPETYIMGEKLTTVELCDLERSHAYLTDLVERQGIPVFSNIHTALACTNKSVHQKLKVESLSLDDGAQPVRFPHARVADKFIKLKDAFNAVDSCNSGRLNFNDANLAFRTLVDESLPLDLEAADWPVSSHRHDDTEPGSNSPRTYTFEEFCCLVSEYKYKRKNIWQKLLASLQRISQRVIDWFHGQTAVRTTEEEMRRRDVFLGGTCGNTTWRSKIAIPMLRKHGLSYFNPQLPEWNTHYIPLEAAIKDSCRLLLYVITADTRGMTSMLEAAHYIGQGCNVVLCIQLIENGLEISGEKMTPLAVKDYNRARSYLADLANRDGVPIFEDVSEAMQCVSARLHNPDL